MELSFFVYFVQRAHRSEDAEELRIVNSHAKMRIAHTLKIGVEDAASGLDDILPIHAPFARA